MGYGKGSGLKISTSLVGVQKSSFTHHQITAQFGACFMEGPLQHVANMFLKRTYPPTHIPSWGFGLKKPPGIWAKLYLQ